MKKKIKKMEWTGGIMIAIETENMKTPVPERDKTVKFRNYYADSDYFKNWKEIQNRMRIDTWDRNSILRGYNVNRKVLHLCTNREC